MQFNIPMCSSIYSIQGLSYKLRTFVEQKMVEQHVEGYSNVENTEIITLTMEEKLREELKRLWDTTPDHAEV